LVRDVLPHVTPRATNHLRNATGAPLAVERAKSQ